MNTSSTVLRYEKPYYVCENAVWFTGNAPQGPWKVATTIPDEVQKIPPEDPSYNVKYVYIYDVQPDVVYMGYLPGYMGCYVYGPTIIYGTGFPYPCWYGPYYYPRRGSRAAYARQARKSSPATGQSSGFDRQQMDRQSYDRNRAQQRQTNASSYQQNSGFSGGGEGGGRR